MFYLTLKVDHRPSWCTPLGEHQTRRTDCSPLQPDRKSWCISGGTELLFSIVLGILNSEDVQHRRKCNCKHQLDSYKEDVNLCSCR